jgi:uncharacterized membrane protein
VKKGMLLLALACVVGVTHAEETCVLKKVRLPVVEVNDLHQEMDLPETATTCTDGKCESHVVKINHFATEPQYQITLAYKGDTVSYESSVAPEGNTVLAQIQECGKKRKPGVVKPVT